jgi:hypothetical protein
MRRLRRTLILAHRYLGILLGGILIMWFASGIGMMYAGGMPALTPDLRLARLGEIDLSRIRIGPQEAAASAGLDAASEQFTLVNLMDRPVWRLGGRGSTTVFADTGEVSDEIGPPAAIEIATRFVRVEPDDIRYEGLLNQPDQWTLTVRTRLPLHKLTVDDADRTQLYVSPVTGEIEMLTTRRTRALAWVAAIPHWLYFTPLRVRQRLWTRTILWTAGAGCVLALLGLVLGVSQTRIARPLRLSLAWIPYRGWMRWHYITGMTFGVFTLTWVFSGFLSMEPFDWAAGPGLDAGPLQRALTGERTDPFPVFEPSGWSEIAGRYSVRQIDTTRIQGAPYYSVLAFGRAVPGDLTEHLLVDARTLAIRTGPFSIGALLGIVRDSYPDVPIRDSTLLTEYDSYYYARDGAAPLPVLRVRFADPASTWFYIDPTTSQLLGSVHRLDRVERWIYNGFHSLDFGFWYQSRPAWDIGVILLSLGGLATTAIGLGLGLKRLVRRPAGRAP